MTKDQQATGEAIIVLWMSKEHNRNGYGGSLWILRSRRPPREAQDVDELEMTRLRECELTHGRVGMLASLGFLVQEFWHPLFSADGGPAIDQIPQLPVWLWVVMGSGIAAAESYRINVAFRELDGEKLKAETALRPGYTPGDLSFDPLNLAPEDPAEFALMQEKELVHARLGMIAAAGFLAQEAVSKATWGTYWGLPDF